MHVLMLFQQKAEKVFQNIHDGLGHAKIKDCFLVKVHFQNQPFIIKALKCLPSFINKDFLLNTRINQVTLKVLLLLKRMSLFHSKITDLTGSLIALPLFYTTLMISRTILNKINMFLTHPSLIEGF